jgi:LuxR family maltose regulon positive regulatory protein
MRSAGLLYISALRIILYRARTNHETTNLKSGIKLAGHLIDNALQSQYIPFAIEMLLVRAQLYAALEDDQAEKQRHSREDYRYAVQLAEPEGFITIFLEQGPHVATALQELLTQKQLETVDPAYVERILAVFPKDESSFASAAVTGTLIEPLSKRELEVLQLIGQGLSNREIAEHLVVTLHTVKKHSSNIYDKLGVNSRTQAVAEARRLNLL